ncbi:hypothetical protein Tco_0686531 [Tanacetum coccineum]
MGEDLILNRSLDLTYGDYIELNDLNEPLKLRRNQVENLGPTIKDGEIIDEPIMDIVETRNDNKEIEGINEYPSFDDELKNEALMKKVKFEESRDHCSFDVEWEDFEHANHIRTNANYNPYLDISRIFNSPAGKINEEAIKDERKPMNDCGVSDLDIHLVSKYAPDYTNEEE